MVIISTLSGSEGQGSGDIGTSSDTPFTLEVDDGISLKPNRPALVVSSTSW